MSDGQSMKAQAPIYSAIDMLNKNLDELGEVITQIGSRIEPVIATAPPSEKSTMVDTEDPGNSSICHQICNASRNVESQMARIRAFMQGVEL